jgi:hypothetical protein
MQSIRTVTRVQSGHRVELVVPELAEGDLVNVTVEPCNKQPECRESVLSFLDSLPEGPRAFPTWKEYERHLQQERDAWDR